MADETYPGIEIRVRTDHGELLNARSDTLNYELMKMWLEAGFTGNEWYPLGGTVLRSVLIEIRAVDVPRLPIELELERELEASTAERCCVCGSADVRYHNYRDQAFCWPCADGDRPAGVDGQVPELTELAELLPSRTAAELAELERFMTVADQAELGELTWRLARLERRLGQRAAAAAAELEREADPDRPAPSTAGSESGATAPVAGEPIVARRPRPRDIWLARIARRARFRSGRSADPAAAIRPIADRRR